MLKKLFSFSNPVGLILTTATIILTLSPEARRGTRKLLVKGAGAALALGDQMKGLTTQARLQLDSVMNEAKEEKEAMVLPDFVGMAKNTGSKIKNSFSAGTEISKDGIEKAGESIEKANDSYEKTQGLFDDIEPAKTNEQFAYNVLNDNVIIDKLNEIDQQFQ
ncbi:hypothetical protein J5Y03_08995 [Bacillus sp. RG28]|uniref:Uncharacterized protein n=1 Tax=Gottfriedia endophytica TaxID=2820819 RepID=A0A940SJC3_9BACI|nr:hypothetical protein [Gottfriedia endophytica]MBP0725326.1 hypothetical protein [Gottfriedia endophytica]